MIVEIRKRWTFDAAHQLFDHDGKCAQPHGHTYTVELAVTGPVQPVDGRPDGGMVVDFGVLQEAWKIVEPTLDHRDLNDSLGEWVDATTSEFLAVWLLQHFCAYLHVRSDVTVRSVTVSETASTSATVYA